jgi:hypothetical protein
MGFGSSSEANHPPSRRLVFGIAKNENIQQVEHPQQRRFP